MTLFQRSNSLPEHDDTFETNDVEIVITESEVEVEVEYFFIDGDMEKIK